MTPAEQMAERLDEHAAQSGEYPTDYDAEMCDEAAAMIRRLSAALMDAKRLIYTYVLRPSETTWLRDHADALRDVGVKV